jgi:hypothetical protein
MDYNSGFNKVLRKRIDKTKEARQGDPLIKRRNNRENRSLMKLNTYLRLFYNNDLEKYTNGYIVYLSPSEYFDSETRDRKVDLEPSLVLGTNCIIYYENNQDFISYSPLERGWLQVVENSTANGDWSGNFAVNIKNANPQKLSFITRTNETVNHPAFSWMDNINRIVRDRLPAHTDDLGGKGLGNYEYDFCTRIEQEKVCYQLAYLIWNTNGFIDFLITKAETNLISWDNELDIRNIKEIGAREYFNICKSHVENYCNENNLIFRDELIRINAIDSVTYFTCCPLCKNEITPSEFFTKVEQDEGRESTQNTITDIVLMHVDPLFPGKLNHKTYNLGWGHHDCNTFQGNKSIIDTLIRLRHILQKHEN